MKIQRFLMIMSLAGAGLLGVNQAWAQWHWLDDQGRKVFSDRPPGPDVPEKNIIKRPNQVPAASAAARNSGSTTEGTQSIQGAAGSTMTKTSLSPAASGAKADKSTAEQAQALKQEQDRVAAAKAQNCASAQRQMAGLKSGGRIARFNDKGEREFLDDAAKANEMRQTQKILDSECR